MYIIHFYEREIFDVNVNIIEKINIIFIYNYVRAENKNQKVIRNFSVLQSFGTSRKIANHFKFVAIFSNLPKKLRITF